MQKVIAKRLNSQFTSNKPTVTSGQSVTGPRALALFSLTQFLLLFAVWFAWDSGAFPTKNFYVGFDFDHFYRSASLWLSHQSPYLNPGFPAPPASLIPYIALHGLPERMAHSVFFCVLLTLLVVSVGAFCRNLRLSTENTILAFIVVFTFAPMYASLNGGNIDALMLVLILAASLVKRSWISDALIGLSVAIKLYSILIPLRWAIQKRWKATLAAAAAAALITAPFARYLGDMMQRLLWRTTAEHTHDNISPAVLFQTLFGHGRYASLVYLAFWLTTFVLMLIYLRREGGERRFNDLKLLPWMMAFPSLVLSYVGILALPIMVLLFKQSESRALTFWERTSLAGIALLNFYPMIFALLLPLTDAFTKRCAAVFYPINAIGVTLLLIGICAQTRKEALGLTSSRAVSS